MKATTKGINFGEIDHFLYVRINCMCADLSYDYKEFIEQAYCLLVEIIDEQGQTHFEVLQKQYKDYADYREMTRYAPRMIEQRHPFVVKGIHEEIHEHLTVIKEENKFTWLDVLRILLMRMQVAIDESDRKDWKDMDIKKFVVEEFLSRRTSHAARSPAPEVLLEPDTYKVDKTKKRRKYEKAAAVYPQKGGFKKSEG